MPLLLRLAAPARVRLRLSAQLALKPSRRHGGEEGHEHVALHGLLRVGPDGEDVGLVLGEVEYLLYPLPRVVAREHLRPAQLFRGGEHEDPAPRVLPEDLRDSLPGVVPLRDAHVLHGPLRRVQADVAEAHPSPVPLLPARYEDQPPVVLDGVPLPVQGRIEVLEQFPVLGQVGIHPRHEVDLPLLEKVHVLGRHVPRVEQHPRDCQPQLLGFRQALLDRVLVKDVAGDDMVVQRHSVALAHYEDQPGAQLHVARVRRYGGEIHLGGVGEAGAVEEYLEVGAVEGRVPRQLGEVGRPGGRGPQSLEQPGDPAVGHGSRLRAQDGLVASREPGRELAVGRPLKDVVGDERACGVPVDAGRVRGGIGEALYPGLRQDLAHQPGVAEVQRRYGKHLRPRRGCGRLLDALFGQRLLVESEEAFPVPEDAFLQVDHPPEVDLRLGPLLGFFVPSGPDVSRVVPPSCHLGYYRHMPASYGDI